jgi:putative two-component system response regulator
LTNLVFPVQVDTGPLLTKFSSQTAGNRLGLWGPSIDVKKPSGLDATILVVEDNDVMRQGLQLMLEADGFRVVSASHGAEALFRMQTTCPDLILSDISMPEMDGYAFFDAVRTQPEWIAIPFIFLTAHSTREEVFEGKKMGAEDYLVKPINRLELVTTVRSRLERNQQLLLAQLKQAYEASLILLSNAIELRDQYTRGHVERVMDYSLAIASQLALSAIQVNILQFGSILHDIGKIHIGESILSKNGPLSSNEWIEMKLHPIIGAELVKNIPYLSPAIPVIRHHHERWDGQGYPDSLAGVEIPLLARIVAVADALDAMTTVRVYKNAFSPEGAYQEIIQCSGKRYDPNIVDAFCATWDDIRSRMG